MPQDEELLIKRIKIGDENAFAELVETHQKMVFNVALRYVRNYDDASDITQEVFIKAYRSIDSFKGKAQISTWLYRITVNFCTDFARKNKLYYKNTVELESENEEGELTELPLPDMSYNPESKLESKELHDALLMAIDSLPKDARDIIIMRDINDMSYNEIADALGIELGTVRSRLARARMRLRNKLVKIL